MNKKNFDDGVVMPEPDSPVAGTVAERPSDAAVGTVLEPAGGWPPDEYTGIGGNYVRDPVTGLRSPAPQIFNGEM
jgi:hypothetical protein